MFEATMASDPAAGTGSRPGAGTTILAIDFGTTYTTGALAAHGKVTLLELDDGTRTPSAVFLPSDGRLVAGVEAMNRAATDPTAFERTPKRRLGRGSILLGGCAVSDADVVAAVLEPVLAEARRQLNGATPDVACLTHPASWRRARRQVLVDAARKMGLPEPLLRAEPVAAAFHYAHQARHAPGGLPEGGALAVYDLGGGTFDAAVIRQHAGELKAVGEPGGIDPLGGIDFDFRVLAHLGTVLSAEHSAGWSALMSSAEPQWVRSRLRLVDDVRRAKEALSRRPTQPVFVDGLNVDVTITRDELLALVRADVERTVATLADTIARTGLTPADLAGIYLVGGSSRIPLVHDLVWERLGVRPTTMESPKSVVALGAAAAVRESLVSQGPRPADPPTGTGAPASAPTSRDPGSVREPWRVAPTSNWGSPKSERPRWDGAPQGPVGPPLIAPPGERPHIVGPRGPGQRKPPRDPGRRKLIVLGVVAVAALVTVGLTVGLVASGGPEPNQDLVGALTKAANGPCQESQAPDWATNATSVQVCEYPDGHAAEIYTWSSASDAGSSLSHFATLNGLSPSSWSGGQYVDVSQVNTGNDTKPGAYAVYNPNHSILLYGEGSSAPSGELLMSWLEGQA